MRRLLVAIISLAVLVTHIRGAQAEEEASVVAVLPLVASTDKLSIYGKAVADAVVRKLNKVLDFRIESLSLTGAMPGRVGLVIDGRIVGSSGGKVILEARVRDPKEGRALGTVATRSLAITKIDTLAAELAGKLAPVVEKADKWRKARAAARANSSRLTAHPETAATTDGPSNGNKPRVVDRRPAMLIVRATGKAAAGTISVSDVATRNAIAMVESLGFRAIVSSDLHGIAKPKPVSSAMRAVNANYALLIDVRGVDFQWHGVLSARGKVRVVLVNGAGKPAYDKTVVTGTLVGSRGDRHDALVHFVTVQAMDIVRPRIKRAIR